MGEAGKREEDGDSEKGRRITLDKKSTSSSGTGGQ